MAKSKKQNVYESKTKRNEQKVSTATLATRIMALFLALLMLLGAISSTLYFFLAKSVSSPFYGMNTYISDSVNLSKAFFTDAVFINAE